MGQRRRRRKRRYEGEYCGDEKKSGRRKRSEMRNSARIKIELVTEREEE